MRLLQELETVIERKLNELKQSLHIKSSIQSSASHNSLRTTKTPQKRSRSISAQGMGPKPKIVKKNIKENYEYKNYMETLTGNYVHFSSPLRYFIILYFSYKSSALFPVKLRLMAFSGQ